MSVPGSPHNNLDGRFYYPYFWDDFLMKSSEDFNRRAKVTQLTDFKTRMEVWPRPKLELMLKVHAASRRLAVYWDWGVGVTLTSPLNLKPLEKFWSLNGANNVMRLFHHTQLACRWRYFSCTTDPIRRLSRKLQSKNVTVILKAPRDSSTSQVYHIR